MEACAYLYRKFFIGMHLQSTSDSVLTAHPGLTAGTKNNPPLPNKPPVGGYGKPNFAPRPPSQSGNKPAPPPKSPQIQVNLLLYLMCAIYVL